MSISALTRRTIILGLGAFAGLSVSGARPARAHGPLRFRDIRVDVSQLRASAGDPTADWVEDELPPDLDRALAAYLSPGGRDGATLVARIETVNLGRSGGGTGPGGGSVDSIEGVLIVSGPRGGMAAETPLRAITSYYASAVDQPLFEQAYHSRVAALAEAFAGWTPRQLGI
jgi:hypothetical protein